MSKPLTDTEALAHYRDELNRTRRAIQELADEMDQRGRDNHWLQELADELYRILGQRP